MEASVFVPHGHKQPAVLCILRSGDRYLLLKRYKDPNKGMYTPVGGKINPFESPRAAAMRETGEETGIRIRDARYCGVLVESSPVEYNWICFVYIADVDRQEPPGCNEGVLEWISPADMLKIPTPMTDCFIYRYILEGKPFMFNAEYDAGLTLREMREEMENRVVYSPQVDCAAGSVPRTGKGWRMKEQRLRETIGELRAELGKASPVDAGVRERIQGMLDEIETLIDDGGEIPAHRHQQFLEKLTEYARHFEASHLSLTLAVGRVIDALSNVGI